MRKFISLACTLTLVLILFSGCSSTKTDSINSYEDTEHDSNIDESKSNIPSTDYISEESNISQTNPEMFSDRDYEVGYDKNTDITIQLNENTAVSTSDSVQISDSTVTITKEGTYIISGTLDDGMIIVNAPDTAKIQLVLDEVNINSKTSAALYIKNADKVFLTLADDTKNTLSNGGTFTAIDENNIDAAVFSKQDLTLNGLGNLTVTSPSGHGIVCKDDLVMTSGTYNISSASHGFEVNDSFRLANATITIDAGKDGIHAENSDDTSLGFVYVSSGVINIESEGDGISAGAYIQIENGDFNIVAGGGNENGLKSSSDSYGGYMGKGRPGDSSFSDTEVNNSTSMKGLKATGNILISSGNITVDSADDSIHSNASITINDGNYIIASGDDGIHADETIDIISGTIQISKSYEGIEALDINISGGDIQLVASDDGLNAAGGSDLSGTSGGRNAMFDDGMEGAFASSSGSIAISGGTLYINAAGDGLDSNGSLSITDGSITVSGPNFGDTSIIDFDTSGNIGGGTFVGTGASGMMQNFSSSSTQGSIMIITGTQPEGTNINLTDADGNVLISTTANQEFSCVILSHASIEVNGVYTLTAGSFTTTITMESIIYNSDNTNNMGGNGDIGKKGGMERNR
ncbi:MAG: carbohydrate-binding domain-containing protein [Coprococcus sp.]